MSYLNPYTAPYIAPIAGVNPVAVASAQAFSGYTAPVTGGIMPYMAAPAYSPMASFPTLGTILPSLAYTAASTVNPAAVAHASANTYSGFGYPSPNPIMGYPGFAPATTSYPTTNASAANTSNDSQLLMMLMMLMSTMKPNSTPAPRPKDNQTTNNQTQGKQQATQQELPPGAQAEIKHKGRKAKFDGVEEDGRLRYKLPFIGVQHGDGSRKDGIVHVDPQTGQQTVTQEVVDDPLVFDIGGDGIKTSNEKTTAKINGKNTVVNNIDDDDAVMTLNGEIVGDQTDLSALGISQKPKDAQQALQLIAEKAFKDGSISNSVNLTPQDLEVLHQKYGVSMRVGDLNAKDGSFKEAGINGINLSKSQGNKTDNFDGKGNSITKNGTSFTRTDGSKGDVGDIWFRSYAA